MRLAVIADVHGNSTALDAVLGDVARRGGCEAYWILGDVVALGPDPGAVLERLVTLPQASFVRGNTDRYVLTGERPPPTLGEALVDSSLAGQAIETAATFAWTHGFLTASGHMSWLETLPLELRVTLPDATRVLGVHASPGRDDGPGIGAHRSDADLAALAAEAAADLVLAGHTHAPFDRTIAGVRLANVGSVSNPPPTDRRASYVVLDATSDGYTLEFRRVEYDHDAVVRRTLRLNHPGADYITACQRGVRPTHLRLTPWRTP